MQTNNEFNKPNIPFNKAWDNLQPQLDAEAARREKNKKRFVFFWWFGVVIIVSGIGFYTITNSNKNSIVETQAKKLEGNDNAVKQPTVNNNSVLNNNENNNKVSTNKNEIQEPLIQIENAVEKNYSVAKVKSQNINKIETTTQFNSTKIDDKSRKEEKRNLQNSIANKSHLQNIINYLNEQDEKQKNILKEYHESLIKNKFKMPTNNNDVKTEQYIASKLNNNIVPTVANNTTLKAIEKPKTKFPFQYGVQFSLPVVKSYNILDANAEKNALTSLIPTLWISKKVSDKNNVLVFANPYSTYYASNFTILNTSNYNITTSQGNNTSNLQNTYTQNIAVNKLIGVEVGAIFQHSFNNKWKLGLGVSNFIAQSALLRNTVKDQNNKFTKDVIYSVGKKDEEWTNISSNFFMAKFEVSYKLKKVDIGASFSKPFTSVFNSVETNRTPINTNVFLRYNFSKN